MPFPFSSLCELLNELDKNRTKSSAAGKIPDLDAKTVVSRFNKHNGIIPRRGTEAVAFLSCLFPERRPDRVFSLRVGRLEKIIQQAQGLGSSRIEDLQSWRTTDGSDFALCVGRVLATTDCESRHGPDATLEELDNVLDQIAAMSAFSSISLREKIKDGLLICIDDTLSRIFRALKSSEAKWMVRMLSKNYSPVCVPESLAMH
jgi:DNA ligase 4